MVRDGVDPVPPIPNIPPKLMPREVLGRDLGLPSLSESDDLEAFSSGSLSEGLRADFERDTEGRSDFFSLVGEDAFFELDFGGGGAAPQKPQDDDC